MHLRCGITVYIYPPLCILVKMDVARAKNHHFTVLCPHIASIFLTVMTIKVLNTRGLKKKMPISCLHIPCSPAFSVTIHKAQGKMYDLAIIDIAKPQSPPYGKPHDKYALLYVAISCVRSLHSLQILKRFEYTMLNYKSDNNILLQKVTQVMYLVRSCVAREDSATYLDGWVERGAYPKGAPVWAGPRLVG